MVFKTMLFFPYSLLLPNTSVLQINQKDLMHFLHGKGNSVAIFIVDLKFYVFDAQACCGEDKC